MKKLAALIRYTVVDNVRQKIFYVLGLFGFVVLAGSGILSAIGGEQKIRVLSDLGYFAAEYIALFSAVLIGTNFIYDEMENKSVYMIAARPVPRWVYLTGRYLGFLLSVSALLLFMALFNAGVVRFAGGSPDLVAAFLTLLSAMKIAVVLALAMLLAMLTTSRAASMGFTLFLWVLGHFTEEMAFLSRLASSPLVKALSWATQFIVPRLDKFSPLDPSAVTLGHLAAAMSYTLLYVFAAVGAAWLVFRKKEF
jgi:ABC-type transport system involved in multi-copper enzyme maturation permease subunit